MLRYWRFAPCLGGAVVLALLAADPAPRASDQTVVINIRGNKYIKAGDTDQKPVEVRVGQTVRWVNQDDVQHTATSKSTDKTKAGEIFDTSFIPDGKTAEVTFDDAKFKAAGGTPGGQVTVEYYCRVHGQTMSSSLVLKAAGTAPPAGATVTIEASSDAVGHYWKPQFAGIKPGDQVVWKNVSGNHALRFTDWKNARQSLDVLDSEVGFDADKGVNKAATSEQKVLLRARVKAPPTGQTEIPYDCLVHGSIMTGKLTFGTPPPPVPPPKEVPVPYPGAKTPIAPLAAFELQVVDATVQNSYYILAADINGDGKPDIVTSGLGEPGDRPGEIAWYENPTWKKRSIALFDVPVGLSAADIDGDGAPDLVVCWNYGHCIRACEPTNGTVSWLRNPGRFDGGEKWARYPIGELMATHRVHLGNFSQTENLELLALPVVGGANGRIHDRIKTTLYSRPRDVLTAKGWDGVVVNDRLRVIHDAAVHKYRAGDGSRLDSALVASEEGLSWLRFGDDKRWHTTRVGVGEQNESEVANNWKGSGSVDVCRAGEDAFGYVAATEPLHGNVLAVYTRDLSSFPMRQIWKRKVLDTFGELSPLTGEGPCHHVIAADLDGDGDDEFLVALRGPLPHQGVYYYRSTNHGRGEFLRQQVSTNSAARIAVADFDGDGRLDFATVPYRVSAYFDSQDPNLLVFYNRIPRRGASHAR